ncbi:Zn-ribbon domain-containing OB-fold protein [Amycolatopsis sp. GM8]|uniref:Zn-ribbon domain-containing OB-fold protein n=1 Tax=Amycolatopsis sp. GM8 TaxID=2896530 RepID=UPI001F18DADC|nr:OB-fold domain-containing protein [Amycolatopsis sp. GM8]
MAFEGLTRDIQSAPFFDAAARDILLVKRCDACGHVCNFEKYTCTVCCSGELSVTEAVGTGTIETWTATALSKDFTAVVAIVELDEGPWIIGRVSGLGSDELSHGMRVAVEFDRIGSGEPVPIFVRSPTERPTAG